MSLLIKLQDTLIERFGIDDAFIGKILSAHPGEYMTALDEAEKLSRSGSRKGIVAIKKAIKKKAGRPDIFFPTLGQMEAPFMDQPFLVESEFEQLVKEKALLTKIKEVKELISRYLSLKKGDISQLGTIAKEVGGYDTYHDYELVARYFFCIADYEHSKKG